MESLNSLSYANDNNDPRGKESDDDEANISGESDNEELKDNDDQIEPLYDEVEPLVMDQAVGDDIIDCLSGEDGDNMHGEARLNPNRSKEPEPGLVPVPPLDEPQ